MHRSCCVLGLVAVVILHGTVAAGDDDNPLQALDNAFQAAVRKADPAIACVRVTRSDVYRRWFGETAAADPCKLGSFDPARAELNIPDEDQAQFEELKKSYSRRSLPPPALLEEIKKRFDLADASNVPESYGSGVVIHPSGLVLTNYHVIRKATKIYVRLADGKGSYADIHAADPRSDLAVLRLLSPGPAPLAILPRGDGGKLRKGQILVGLAQRFAPGMRDGGATASWGIVSDLRQKIPPPATTEQERALLPLRHFETLIQTDARINPGCSGAALLNLKGELVGLTTTLAGGENAGGYAIPLDANHRAYIDRLEKGLPVEYGFLGVSFRPDGPGGGVRVSVIAGSAAERAGMRDGDVILRVNDMEIGNNDHLFLAVSTLLAGTDARLEVSNRTTPTRVLTVHLDKLYIPGTILAARRAPAVHGLRVDFVSVLFQRDRLQQGIPRGVFVSEVQAGSAAEAAELQSALITQVNGQDVDSPAEFHRRASVKGPLELTVVDRRQPTGYRKVKLR